SIAHAGVVIDGTRHIYPQQRREITLRLTNDDERAPRLVQVWLDQGDPASDPSNSEVPFSLSPPVFRLYPQKSQAVRLVYTEEPLPADRESLFWLNALEIPPKVNT
ncbi:fimbria/pilus periplasmic chaperone, partial [Pseudomonas viridiflava]|uniref:fimbria/pilus periplasmic chaperone n=1 Tax=Pseudomonas viridiflava TaxID=33069 RepID=UPI0013DFE958